MKLLIILLILLSENERKKVQNTTKFLTWFILSSFPFVVGLVVDPTILDIDNVEVIAAKAEDKQAPIIVVQCMAQQINCIKNREGEIVEVC